MARRGRGWIKWALFLGFVAVPIAEIYVLIKVGQTIGPWWTILLLILDSIIGTWLIRREGRRAWLALQGAVSGGRMPARELADAALILTGGALMLSPGFVTDVFGIAMILPFTRPVARRALSALVAQRITLAAQPPHPPRRGGDGPVVPGEVVD